MHKLHLKFGLFYTNLTADCNANGHDENGHCQFMKDAQRAENMPEKWKIMEFKFKEFRTYNYCTFRWEFFH